ncbi:MAG TPA: hypothetical protein VF767_04510 [Bryobacteraceae bacterium]
MNPGRGILPVRSERMLIAILALAATYAFFHPYLPPFRQVHLWSDIEGYHYPLQQYAFQALKEGRFPQWDSSIYSGITFVGNVQAALLYPPTWLMFAAFWRHATLPFLAIEIFTFVHVWLAFVLCYMWLRGRAGPLAGALGAAVFAYTGFMVYETLHPGVLCAMAWMPLGLWGIDQAAARRDWRPLWKVAAASALSFLAGYPACWIVYAIVAAVYALGSREHWRAAAATCAAIAVSPLLFLAQLLPALEARSMMAVEAKYGLGAYGWRMALSYFVPNWFDFNPGHPADFEPGCIYLYLGLPALFAIVWALARRRFRPYAQPLAALAAALILANPPEFLFHLVERIPPLNNTMQPFNFFAAAAAMAALITAIALNDFLGDGAPSEPAVPRWAVCAAVGALLAWAARQLWIAQHGGAFAIRGRALAETAVALGIFAIGMWNLRQAGGWRRVLLGAVLLLAAGVDYKVFGSARWFNALPGDVDRERIRYGIGGIDDDAYRAMEKNRHYRILTADSCGPAPTDYRTWGLATPQGFDPFLPLQYKKTIERWTPFRTNRVFYPDMRNENMLRTLGVRYLVVREGVAEDIEIAADANFRLIGRKKVFAHVYEYLHAKPAFYWEDERAGGAAEPTAWLPEVREFQVRSESGGRFVLAEQFYPGWTAAVDGKPVRIERWGGAFQSIAVTPGEHRVRFEFNSLGLATGTAITVALAVLLALVA